MLTPAVEPARPRFRFLLGLALGASVAGVTVAMHTLDPFAEDAAPAPVVVQTPLPMPQPILVPITVTPPPPPPPPVIVTEEEPAPLPPRALVPTLSAACVGVFGVEPDSACSWDDGFPAISHDAQTIVVQRSIDDSGRGHPNLYIDFIDVATSKVTRTIKILAADEFDPETDKHVAKVKRRVAAAQQAIDAIGFRSMIELARDGEPSTSNLRVDGEAGSIRVIDPARGVALFQATFTGEQAFPGMPKDDEMECNHPRAYDSSAAWDEETRTIAATVHYSFGGCLCGGDSKTFVRKVR